MRYTAFALNLALIWGLVGCGSSSVYVKRGDELLAKGDYAQAMVTYEAHLDSHQNDRAVIAKRDRAATEWIIKMVKRAQTLSPRRAVGLLLAVGKHARIRKLTAAIRQHVAPALDAAVMRVWSPPKTFKNEGAARRAVGEGEALAKVLPRGSKTREALHALKKRAVAFHLEKARAAKHVGAQYFYYRLAAQYGGPRIPPDLEAAYDRQTLLSYDVSVVTPPRCAAYRQGLHQRMAAIPVLKRRRDGLDTRMAVVLACSDRREVRRTSSKRTCTKVSVQTHVSRFCQTKTFQTSTASMLRRTYNGTAYQTTSTTYRKVPYCRTSRTRTRKVSVLTGQQVEQKTYDYTKLEGWVYVRAATEGRAYPVNVQTHTIHYKSWGPCGSKAWPGSRKQFPMLLGHGLFIQLNYIVADLKDKLTRAAIARADAASSAGRPLEALGHMAVAARLPNRIESAVGTWFLARTGLDTQALKEIVLGAARVIPSASRFPDRLELPAVDYRLRDKAQKKDKSGNYGY